MSDQLETRASGWVELSSAAGTTNAVALTDPSAKAPTTTKPETDEAAGRFVFDPMKIYRPEGDLERAIHYEIVAALQDAADEEATGRAWRWRPWGDLWIPTPLFDFTITAGSRAGIAGAAVDETWLFADSIAKTADYSRGSSYQEHAPALDGVAGATFDATGGQLIEFELTIGTATAVRLAIASV